MHAYTACTLFCLIEFQCERYKAHNVYNYMNYGKWILLCVWCSFRMGLPVDNPDRNDAEDGEGCGSPSEARICSPPPTNKKRRKNKKRYFFLLEIVLCISHIAELKSSYLPRGIQAWRGSCRSVQQSRCLSLCLCLFSFR